MKVYIDKVLLPVAPEKILKDIKSTNKTYTLIDGTQVSSIRPAGLMEITLQKILLPNNPYDFAEPTGYDAQYYITWLNNLKNSGKPIELMINESEDGLCNDAPGSGYLVTLETVKITQDADLGRDAEVDLKFKEYVEAGLVSIELPDIKSSGEKKKTRAAKSTDATTYTVQAGDTLWSIAKKFYGDGALYPYLASINSISNPNIIHTGQVLKIGPTDEAKAYKGSAKSKSSSGSSKSSANTKKTSQSVEIKPAVSQVLAGTGVPLPSPLIDIKMQQVLLNGASKTSTTTVADTHHLTGSNGSHGGGGGADREQSTTHHLTGANGAHGGVAYQSEDVGRSGFGGGPGYTSGGHSR